MSGIAWIILDCLLALAAVGGTVKVIATPPPAPLPAERLEPKSSQKGAEKPGTEKRPVRDAGKEDAAKSDELPANASLDDLWKKSLFLPSRQEQEPSETAAELSAEAAAAAAKNFEFELIGIAQISPADQPPAPVAILRSKQQASSRNAARNRRGRGGKDAPKEPEARKATQAPVKLIFHEGDPLNDTGYLLKAIHPDQKMVELVRGSETIQLRINYAGEEATKRRQEMAEAIQAKKEQQAQQEQQASIRQRQAQQAQEAKEQEAARNQANPGQPPPPPGMGNNFPGQDNTAQASGNNAGNAAPGQQNGVDRDLQRRVEQRARQRQQGGADSSGRSRGTGSQTSSQK